MSDIHTIKRGDIGRPLRIRLEHAGGRPAPDLELAASIHFFFRRRGTNTVTGGPCVLIDPAAINPDPVGSLPAGAPYGPGWVEYIWTAADVATPGTYEGEVEARWGTATRATFPTRGYLEFRVEADLGDA